MFSYLVVRGTQQGTGSTEPVAVVADDGQNVRVIGRDSFVEDIEDMASDLQPADPDSRLRLLCGSMSYWTIEGPYSYDGELGDRTTRALDKLYSPG